MRVYKAEQDIDIPTDFNLTQLLNSTFQPPHQPNTSPTIAHDDIESRTLSHQQFRNTAGQLAQGLVKAFQPRDQSRWAIILPNSVAYLEACHAVLWLGGVFCPINHLLTAHEIGNALAIVRPEYIITYDQSLARLKQGIILTQTQHPSFKPPSIIIGLGRNTSHPSLHSYLSSTSLPIPSNKDTRQRLASIHLSSGTTGNSKGVALTHYNYIANVLQMTAHDPDRWKQGDTIVAFTPFVHIANTTIPLFLGPWTGACHVIMAKYDLEQLCALVQKHKASAMQCTPAIAVAIANTDLCKRYDLASVRHMVVGGLPLPREVYERFLSKGNWKTIQLYGMTEASPYVVWQKQDETLPVRGQLGKLLPGMSARLCDETTGQDVKLGEAGELWIKGPNVTSGYVDNPTATAAAFKPGGWYNTGDVCTFSPEGYLTIVGRTKELIKSSGFQVAPTELEGYLNGHPAIADVAVGAIVDKERMTEVPTAYVVLKPEIMGWEGKIRALKEIQHALDGKVSGYKKLRGGVWEVKVLPRTSTGKFVRRRLAEGKTGLSSFDEVVKKSKL